MSFGDRLRRSAIAVVAVGIAATLIFSAEILNRETPGALRDADRDVAVTSTLDADPAPESRAGGDGRTKSGRDETTGRAAGGVGGLPVIDLLAITGGQDVLDHLGIDRDFDAWARARGFAWGFDPSASPYFTLSIKELEELVETGDKDAALALARAMAGSDPAAALDLLQELALEGNIDAMIEASALYGGVMYGLSESQTSTLSVPRVADLQSLGRQGIDFELEGMAWGLLYDSYMGYPRAIGTPPTSVPLSRQGQACDRAVELRRLIEARALEEDRRMPAIEPAPFGLGTVDGDSVVLAACPNERLPTADFSQCQPIRVLLDGEYFDGYVCP